MAGHPQKRILPNPNQSPPPQPSSMSRLPPRVVQVGGQKQALRVNRACNACRKQKMRCAGPENPPCVRCKTQGIPCVFENVPKPDVVGSSQRLEALETQFLSMQGTLSEILHHLQRSSGAGSDAFKSAQDSIHEHQTDSPKHGSLFPFSGGLGAQQIAQQPLPRRMLSHNPYSRSSHGRDMEDGGSPSALSDARPPGSTDGLLNQTYDNDNGPLPPFHSLLPSTSDFPRYTSQTEYSNIPEQQSFAPSTSSMRSSASADYPSLAQALSSSRPLLPSIGSASASHFHSPNTNHHQQPYHATPYGHVPSTNFPTHQQHHRSLDTLPPIQPPNATPSPALRHASMKYDRRHINIDHLADSAVTSAANSDDEGDIPTEAMVRPIHVLDTLASEPPKESDYDHSREDSTNIQRDSRSASSATTQETQNSRSAPRKRKRSPVSQAESMDDPSRPDVGRSIKQKLDDDGPRFIFQRTGGLAEAGVGDPLGRETDGDIRDRNHGNTPLSKELNDAESNAPGSPRLSPSLRTHHVEQDVVTKGIISDEDARALYQLYFTGCYRLLACFSPTTDTYESMRERSSFCFCSILLVAARVRDGGGPKSKTQIKLERESIRMARNSIYPVEGDDDISSNVTLESIQAMLLFAGWSHSTSGTGWLVAGHAIRCAVQLGVHKALPRLERRKLRSAQASHPVDPSSRLPIPGPSPAGSGVPDVEIKDDMALIHSARTWCALYVFEAQISFGTGRPAMMKADKSILHARDILLGHPLSTATDSRVVSTCELLALQGKIIDALEPLDGPVDARTFETVHEATKSIDAWLEEWDGFMGRDHPVGDFFRASAAIQRSYAHLFTRSVALRQLKTTVDAQNISPMMKETVLAAIGNALDCVELCVHNKEYREGMRFAVAYTHTCAAFAGGFLLRFARLFPDNMDVMKTISLVEELAQLMNEVSAGRFGRTLTSMLNHTRNRIRTKRSFGLQPVPNVSSFLPLQHSPDAGERTEEDTLTSAAPSPAYDAVPLMLQDPVIGKDPLPDRVVENHMPASQQLQPQHQHPHPHQQVQPHHGLSQNSEFHPHQLTVNYLPDVPPSELHHLLGEGDWPPWIRNSMFGDLQLQNDNTIHIDMEQSFAWAL